MTLTGCVVPTTRSASFGSSVSSGEVRSLLVEPVSRSTVPDRDRRRVSTGYFVDIELISGLTPKMRPDNFSPEDACHQLKEMGYRSVTVPELLGLGAQYPNEQRRYVLACPSEEVSFTVSRKGRLSLRHVGHDRARALSINFVDNLFWDRETRFAAVKITKSRPRSR